MEKQQMHGYIMAGVGFTMILINALSYIFDRELKSPVSSVIGIIFVGLGLNIARTSPA